MGQQAVFPQLLHDKLPGWKKIVRSQASFLMLCHSLHSIKGYIAKWSSGNCRYRELLHQDTKKLPPFEETCPLGVRHNWISHWQHHSLNTPLLPSEHSSASFVECRLQWV